MVSSGPWGWSGSVTHASVHPFVSGIPAPPGSRHAPSRRERLPKSFVSEVIFALTSFQRLTAEVRGRKSKGFLERDLLNRWRGQRRVPSFGLRVLFERAQQRHRETGTLHANSIGALECHTKLVLQLANPWTGTSLGVNNSGSN